MEVFERVGEALGTDFRQQGGEPKFETGTVAELRVAGTGFFEGWGDRIEFLIRGDQIGNRLVGDSIDLGDEIADAVAVNLEAEFDLGSDFIALGDGNITHVVAKAGKLGALPVVPGMGGTHPSGDAILDLGVGPVADHHFAAETEARVDEPGLAVSVGRLVQVHEIHVNGLPRQVAIELGVEVKKGLLERSEAADPHLRGREGVHPKNEAGAVVVGVGLDADP